MESGPYRRMLVYRRSVGGLFYVLFLLAVLVGLVGLATLLVQVALEGVPWLSWHLLTDHPSRHADEAGLKSAMMGTIWVMGLVAAFSIPVGVGTAVYLEEYAPRNWITRVVEINISNLAGVPSIVYGLLGLALFVQWMALGRSALAGALTLSLLVLPIVILGVLGGDPGRSPEPSAGGLCPWGHPVGRYKGCGPAICLSWNAHRHHPGHVQGHRRGGPRHRHKRPRLCDIHSHPPPGPVHRPPHPDLQLGPPCPRRASKGWPPRAS